MLISKTTTIIAYLVSLSLLSFGQSSQYDCGVDYVLEKKLDRQELRGNILLRMGYSTSDQIYIGNYEDELFIRFSGFIERDLSLGQRIRLNFVDGTNLNIEMSHEIRSTRTQTGTYVHRNREEVSFQTIKALSEKPLKSVTYSSNRVITINNKKSQKIITKVGCLIKELGQEKCKLLFDIGEKLERQGLESSLDNSSICEEIEIEKDEFTGHLKINSPFRLFFAETPEVLKKHFPNEPYTQMSIKTRSIDNRWYLQTKWIFQTENAYEYYGIIPSDSKLMLKFSDNSVISIIAIASETGDTDYDKEETVYSVNYRLSSEDIIKLRMKDVTRFRVYWSKGYVDYDCMNPNYLMESIKCIDSKK